MDEKIAHLTFIQQIIARMANNSFLIRGWSIVLVTALLVVERDEVIDISLIATFSVSILFLLDAYFFYQELLYRELYDDVVKEKKTIDLFSLKVKKGFFESCSYLKRIFGNVLLISVYLLLIILVWIF